MSIVVEPVNRRLPAAAATVPEGPRVNLGCGPVFGENWINVDGSRRARLVSRAPRLDRLLVRLGLLRPSTFHPGVVYHDLRRPLPWKTNSVAAIYAGEVWEHFEYPDAVRVTCECHRVLMPGGALRLCVPDGVEFWERYLSIFIEEQAKDRAHQDAARLRAHVQMYFDDICTRPPGLRSFGHYHKWQYDEVQLMDLFTRCGFEEVARRAFRDSRIPDIGAIERSDFLIVEGIKGAEQTSPR